MEIIHRESAGPYYRCSIVDKTVIVADVYGTTKAEASSKADWLFQRLAIADYVIERCERAGVNVVEFLQMKMREDYEKQLEKI